MTNRLLALLSGSADWRAGEWLINQVDRGWWGVGLTSMP
jgi:hypothetical protein